MKIFLRNIHLYLSLVSGIVIMIACLTGSMLVFEKELQELFNHERYYVKPIDSRISLENLLSTLKNEYPGAKLAGVKVYKDQNRSIEAGLIFQEEKLREQPGVKAGSFTEKRHKSGESTGPRITHTAFINPYTGKIIELYAYKETFFYKVLALHRWLLGSNNGIGKYIVGVSTFIFMFILITGILLWWPKTKTILLQRLKIKTNSGLKRLNHDLHIVTGFYSAIFLFVFAFTAMSWSFSWFNKGIYSVTGSTAESPQPPPSEFKVAKRTVTIDEAYSWAKSNFRTSGSFNIRLPKDSTGIISISVGSDGSSESQNDSYYMDQYTGKILGSLKFQDKNAGQRVKAHIKPIHTGSIFGLPSKVIAFVTCLFGVSFPVTGTIMWVNRLKKGRKTSANRAVSLA